MKKIILPFMLLIMFVLTACGNADVKENEQEGEPSQQAEEKPEENGDNDSKTDSKNDHQSEDDVKILVQKSADEVLKLLMNKNSEDLSAYVHTEKGVLFSPYVYVETDAVTFDKEKVKDFFEDTEIYKWGVQDGSGEPIELTPSDYYGKYIYDGEFEEADEIVFDQEVPRGNSLRNISEIFPDSHTVEYYVKGTEENGNMDWKALNLVFEQDEQGDWKLVAIVHDQWTI